MTRRPGAPKSRPGDPLTAKQGAVVDYMLRFYDARGEWPRLPAMVAHFGICDTAIRCRLAGCVNKGYVVKGPGAVFEVVT